MRKLLKITLKSDLCAAAGKNYAVVIDNDTSLDEYGIPYIPSRRLKGCLRDAAKMIGFSECEIKRLFGTGGNSVSGALRLGDARIKNYFECVDEIRTDGISPANVTDLFCSLRNQTALENDTAKDGSLRFTRVVNRFSPFDNKEMEFYAEIEFGDDDYQSVEKLCKALRNIGYHRNRGLGSVVCSLTDYASVNNAEFSDCDVDADTLYRIEYCVFLKNDLMLPANDANETGNFIPGASVLGALASKYKGDNFEELFLSGKARFGNLYVSDCNANDYVPVPGFLGKIKIATCEDDKGIKNLIMHRGDTSKIYKPLKSGFVNNRFGLKKPKFKITYHNAMCNSDGGLYTQVCLCAGQYFKGEIIASGDLVPEIISLLEDNSICFGRSKTAQYASCEIVSKKLVERVADVQTVKAGSVVAYVCESDVVLTDENGIFVAELAELKKQLGIEADLEALGIETRIVTGLISGYNSKWNLKKPHVPVVCAGSCIVLKAEKDMELPDVIFVGEKQNEGFGKVRVYTNAEKYSVESETVDVSDSGCCVIGKMIGEAELNRKIISKAIEVVEARTVGRDNKPVYRYLDALDMSQLGRALLMNKESVSLEDFRKRISSIKTDKFRKSFTGCFGGGDNRNGDVIFFVDGVDISKDNEKAKKLIETILILKKYQMKAGAGR